MLGAVNNPKIPRIATSVKLELTVTRWLVVRAEGRLAIATVAVLAVCATILAIFYLTHPS